MPTVTIVPSGQVIVAGGGGGGGGGSGQGTAASITEPSGQVWVAGVVAHAETPARSPSRISFLILSLPCDFGPTTKFEPSCSYRPKAANEQLL